MVRGQIALVGAVLVTLSVVPAFGTEQATTLSVTPNGTGVNCTASQPCSLTVAQQRVRQLAPTMSQDIVVALADGRYRLTAPLQLTAADSGHNGHTVRWSGTHAVLDGGIAVTGWSQHDAAKNIWVADVPAGTQSRQLYVNGVRSVRARGLGCAADQCKYTKTGLSGVDSSIAGFAHPEDVEAVMDVRWRDFHCGVASAAGSTVTLDQPCWNNANTPTQTAWETASPSSSRFHGVRWFENAYELLGTPGQFYLDQHANKVYYVPRSGNPSNADIELPVAEQLLTVSASDVSVSGLTFTDTTWLNPSTSEGYAGAQAGYYVNGTRSGTIPGAGEDYARTQSAVTVSGSSNVDFDSNTFTHLGGAGIAVVGGTHNSVVENSKFTDLSGGGIFVGDTQAASKTKTADNVVRRNTITAIGAEFEDAVGVMGGYNNGLTIDHNTISQVPYSGISVGWGWNFVGNGDTQHDIVLEHNSISAFMQQLFDGGAIYTQAQSPDSKVYANDIDFAHTNHSNGIYHDERSAYYTDKNNVIRNTANATSEFKWVSAWASYSHDLIVKNNWTDAKTTVPPASASNVYGPNSIGLTTMPDEAKQVIADAGSGAPAEDRSVRFRSPTNGNLTGLTDIEVSAPIDTRSVQFSVDGTAISEMTELYADGTGLAPEWRVATDAGWFPDGGHVLTAQAITGQGVITATMPVTTHRPADPAGTQSLNGTWKFAVSGELPSGALDGTTPPAVQPGFDEHTMTGIVVPSSFGAVRNRWNDDAGQLSLYRDTVTLPASNQRSTLVFDSCYFACQYFVNGKPVGSSTGGYLPVRLDVTDAVRSGTNLIAVVVDNRVSKIRPIGINTDLYWNWGGITQGVHLERAAQGAITSVTANGAADGSLVLRANGQGTAAVTITDPTGRRLPDQQVTFSTTPVTLHVPNPQLWNLDTPLLYQVQVRPTGSTPISTHAGFRTVKVSGSDIELNGQIVRNLPGFNRHEDYPGLGRTQPDGLADREMTMVHDKGFRIFRPAHYPTTPAELDAADRLGMLVLEEINVTQANATQLASDTTHNFAKGELSQVIARDAGHPSIIAWSVGNENATNSTQGAGYVHDLITYGKTLDTTRLFTHVTAWATSDKAYAEDDFIAVNYYDGWYSGKASDIGGDLNAVQAYAADKPMLLSEYGAEADAERPGTGKGTEYYQAQLIDTYNQQLGNREHLIGTMYWTSSEFMLTPAGGGGDPIPVRGFHQKGLLTWFRHPKQAWDVIIPAAGK